MILPVYVFGQPVLRKVAEDITKEYTDLDKLLNDMHDTMYRAEGIGLAAPQIGLPIRLFIIDADPLKEDFPELEGFKKVFINARIVELSGKDVAYTEGCLSLPTIREEVKRPSKVRIKYMDANFVEHDEIYEGFGARIIQHEYDHIDGKLFVDHLNPLKRRLLKGRLNDVSKGNVDIAYRIKTAK